MKVTKKEVKEVEEKETKLNDCLALWLHKSKEGKKFLSGKNLRLDFYMNWWEFP